MSNTEKEVKELISNPEVRVWLVWYLRGGSDPIMKIFKFAGNMLEARNEAWRHCNVMGYRFLRCRPFIVDLRMQEQAKMGAASDDPEFNEDLWDEEEYKAFIKAKRSKG